MVPRCLRSSGKYDASDEIGFPLQGVVSVTIIVVIAIVVFDVIVYIISVVVVVVAAAFVVILAVIIHKLKLVRSCK